MQFRIRAIILLFVIAFLLLFSRLTYIQFYHPIELGKRAERQSKLIVEIPPYRGKIKDRLGRDLALDVQVDSLGVHARDVVDKFGLAKSLSEVLNLKHEWVMERLGRDKAFVWIKRKITSQESRKIQNLDRDEIEFRKEWKRLYPNASVGSHVIGFAGMDHKGLEGVERHFDSYLKGVPGWKFTQKDAKQREVVARQTDGVLPQDGFDVVLTLDLMLQHAAESLLQETCSRYKAKGGSIVVLNPENGDILAMSNFPTFDPNVSQEATSDQIRNRAITDIYEPGSVFKVITLSALLKHQAADLEDVFNCENGEYRTGGRILHDVYPYRDLTLKDVIIKSSNIGITKAAERLGADKLYDMLRQFGVSSKTGSNLPGEVSGILRGPARWSKTSLSSIAIGQEVGLTALQLAHAIGAISNDGMLMRPRIVKRIERAGGEILREYESMVRRRVMTPDTARQVQGVMEAVIQEGTGRRAQISVQGVRIGGKTGTSQKLEEDGSYSHRHFIASFAGFVHNDRKKAVINVMIDDPLPLYYGGIVAAPVFAELAREIILFWEREDEVITKAAQHQSIGTSR